MAIKLEYDAGMGRRISARGAVFALCLLAVASAGAQVHGMPGSVTSLGFGGQFTPGVPASITSLGPSGFQNFNRFFTTPPCCINPLFPANLNPPFFHPHHRDVFFPVAVPVYSVPYTPVIVVQPALGQPMYEGEEDESGGPTIFDRRGTRSYERERSSQRQTEEQRAEEQPPTPPAATPAPAAEQPPTVLVFKDGHTLELQNYAILGAMVYDLTPGHPRKIPLSDVDLQATAKQNDDRGIEFSLPTTQNN